jgi:hypothetical protein
MQFLITLNSNEWFETHNPNEDKKSFIYSRHVKITIQHSPIVLLTDEEKRVPTSTKHNKYVVNQNLEHLNDSKINWSKAIYEWSFPGPL